MGPITPDWNGGPPKDRETVHGYVWTVYPANSSHAMVATGIHASEQTARGCVEHVLGITEGLSAWGVVCAPGGKYDVCRRAETETGYHWAPLHPELAP